MEFLKSGSPANDMLTSMYLGSVDQPSQLVNSIEVVCVGCQNLYVTCSSWHVDIHWYTYILILVDWFYSCYQVESGSEMPGCQSSGHERQHVIWLLPLPANVADVPRATLLFPCATESSRCRALTAHAGLTMRQPPCSITWDIVVKR